LNWGNVVILEVFFANNLSTILAFLTQNTTANYAREVIITLDFKKIAIFFAKNIDYNIDPWHHLQDEKKIVDYILTFVSKEI
jgi:isopenicillin N synthase-like dioxygenase